MRAARPRDPVLLARIGLRAGEVVTLELGDILWRTGEVVIRGKGWVKSCLPLLSDIGEALALYLSQDRGTSLSRQIFLRMHAPRVGLACPAAVGHIVRQAVARVDLRPSRGAAHLFRHSLATRMIRHGASVAEISEILRYRAPRVPSRSSPGWISSRCATLLCPGRVKEGPDECHP
jgi:integrase/recombinase XerD